MDTAFFEYGLLWVIIVLTFFSFLIGVNKMLQVIVSTSFIMLIVLWWSWFLSYLWYYIALTPSITFFSFTNNDIISFVQSADAMTSLIIFLWLIIYAIHYADMTIPLSSKIFSSKFTQILLSPIAIISVVLSLSVAIIGIDVFSITFLQKIAVTFTSDSFVYHYVFFLPLGIIMQWLLTLVLLFPKHKDYPPSYDDI